LETISKEALVIGGGVAGIQASLDLASMGIKVQLVEKKPCIGGRMAQLDKTFPTNDCSICILAPKLSECGRHPNITINTLTEVKKVEGKAGNFTVELYKHARYIKEDACINCGLCIEKCPTRVEDEFDCTLRKRKAVYLYYTQGIPAVMTIDKEHCLYLKKGACRLCEKNCDKKAIDFDQKDSVVKLDNIGSIIVATGFDVLEDSKSLASLGHRTFRNVVTAMEFERLLCASGPQGGHLHRLSDGKAPKRIAFLQCIGSRDARTNEFCSSVCCMYTTKEAMIAHEHDNELESTVFYIDLRAGGKGFQKFLKRGEAEYNIKYKKSKIAEITTDKDENPLIIYEDLDGGEIKKQAFDMVILATCMIPPRDIENLAGALHIDLDKNRFIATDTQWSVETSKEGIFTCGCSHEPMDIPRSVAEASAASAKAAEIIRQNGGE
jgi:heterodisulfide reductase subunit A